MFAVIEKVLLKSLDLSLIHFLKDMQGVALTPYHAQYFAYELSKRSSSDSMQKLASTLVDAQVVHAEFTHPEHGFTLLNNPFVHTPIPLGTYKMGKEVNDAHVYRINHPLAQNLIEQAKTKRLNSSHLDFNYSQSPSKISILQPLLGLSGWLLAKSVTISSLETEDYLLFAGMTTGGVVLDDEQCRRLFSLQASMNDGYTLPKEHLHGLNQALDAQKIGILEHINTRNTQFFELELDKLDKWGEDKRSSLKVTLKDLDEQIKELKKQARVAANLPEKLKLEKERKKRESERDTAWREYDSAAKDIDRAKDQLIEAIEAKLSQDIIEQALFLVSWSVV